MKRDELQKSIVSRINEADKKAIIYAATGFGKTKVVIDTLAEQPKAKILWLVDRVKLRDEDVPAEIKKWGKNLGDITLACYNSIHKFEKKKFDYVILDEADRITKRVDKYLSLIKFNNFIAVTATRPAEEKEKYLLKRGKIVFNYGLDDAADEGVIAPYEMMIVWTDMDNKVPYIEAGNKKKRFHTTERKQLAYYDRLVKAAFAAKYAADRKHGKNSAEARRAERLLQIRVAARTDLIYKSIAKKNIAQFILRNYLEDDKLLILTQRIAIAEELCDKSYNSLNPNSNKNLELFRSGKIKRLSACTALDRGINIPNLDTVLIHQLSSSQRALIQRAGRALRYRKDHLGKIIIIGARNCRDEQWIAEATQGIRNVDSMTERDVSKGKFKEWLDTLTDISPHSKEDDEAKTGPSY